MVNLLKKVYWKILDQFYIWGRRAETDLIFNLLHIILEIIVLCYVIKIWQKLK